MTLLKDKVALITGASQGIGYAIAEDFLRQGAMVVVNGYTKQMAQDAAKALTQATGGTCIGIGADVTKSAEVDALFSEMLDTTKTLDILVNNAGIARDGLLMRMSEDDWDAVLSTNLKGTFLCSKAACRPLLKAKGGSIISISSVVGVAGNSGQANYAASKAGVIGFTKSLAKELGSRGVRANAVAPGFINTSMTAQLSEEVRNNLIAQIPLGRFAEVTEVASVCRFLASDLSRYVTGQVIRVDGGMMI